jgi:hypothetical protein
MHTNSFTLINETILLVVEKNLYLRDWSVNNNDAAPLGVRKTYWNAAK